MNAALWVLIIAGIYAAAGVLVASLIMRLDARAGSESDDAVVVSLVVLWPLAAVGLALVAAATLLVFLARVCAGGRGRS